MQFDAQTRLVRVEGILSTALDDDLVLMDVSHDRYYGMNPVSRRIWELLEAPRSLGEVCNQLLVEFEVEAGQCEREVVEFTEALLNAGLVKTLGS